MDLYFQKIYPIKVKQSLLFNWCRLYTRSLRLSQLCKANGTFIEDTILTATPRTDILEDYKWPKVSIPNEEAVKCWKDTLMKIGCNNNKSNQLINPMNKNTMKSVNWRFFHNSINDIIYEKHTEGGDTTLKVYNNMEKELRVDKYQETNTIQEQITTNSFTSGYKKFNYFYVSSFVSFVGCFGIPKSSSYMMVHRLQYLDTHLDCVV